MRGFPAQVGLGFGPFVTVTASTSDNPSVVAKETLKEMLARSITFQNAVGATGTLAAKIAFAKTRIHKSAYVNDAMTRPFAVICKNESDKHSLIGGGESQRFMPSGGLEVRLERAVPAGFLNDAENDIAAGSEGDAEDDFEEFYEGCIADINALAGTEGYLFLRNWDVLEGPTLFDSSASSSEGGQKNIYAVKLLCNWGIE